MLRPLNLLTAEENQFDLLVGVADDDVARLELFLKGGTRWPVALRDDVFLVEAPRTGYPFELVAYDKSSRVIGIERPPGP